MQLDLENSNNPFTIKSYGSGFFEVNQQRYQENIIISPDNVERWNITNLEQLDIEIFLKYSPDVLLIGTGAQMKFLSPVKIVEFQQHHIGIEIMPTASACRTFNVLLSENRNVIAALILI